MNNFLTNRTSYDFLLNLNKKVAEELLKCYARKKSSLNLLFPNYRLDNKIRVSEQELRFAFALLFKPELGIIDSFAVEVPTKEIYNFSNKDIKNYEGRSAATDMAFYLGIEQKLNIEFKSLQPNKVSVRKDLFKLINEPISGAWCHIFENANNNTITTFFEKINESIKDIIKDSKMRINGQKYIFFSILIVGNKGKIKHNFYWKNLRLNILNHKEIKFDNFEGITISV